MTRCDSIPYGCVVLVLASSVGALGANLVVEQNGARTDLSLEGQNPFRSTTAEVIDTRLVTVSGSSVLLALWKERVVGREHVPYYAISFDGAQFWRVRRTSYQIKLADAHVDPLAQAPHVAPSLSADPSGQLFVVQFVTQPLKEFRRAIRDLGGKTDNFIPNHAYIVEMDAATKAAVAALPYVRWVGAYHPAYRLEKFLRDNLDRSGELFPVQRYNIAVFEHGLRQKQVVADRIEALGATINNLTATGFLLEATLTPEQLLQVIRWNEVLFVDRWSPPEFDMDNARIVGGANFVETVAGYTGQGVRGEVADANIVIDHPDWSPLREPIIHPSTIPPTGEAIYHGTAVFGIVFADGSSDPPEGKSRGMLPDAQGSFADVDVEGSPMRGDRGLHTCQLVTTNPGNCCRDDTNCPYAAVFQTNSWGDALHTTTYTNTSAVLDEILFRYDILVTHSQGNVANQQFSRQQAWAKNVVSVGAFFHDDDADPANDQWMGTVSTGPASDGRVKPDLTQFDGKVFTSGDCNPSCTIVSFGTTSASTPIVAGHFGLFFQMWADGIFGNDRVDPNCDPLVDNCVFINRPHMTTAKAMIINTAFRYPNTPNDFPFFARKRQGWGRPDVKKLYDLRDKFFAVDEADVLSLDPGMDTARYGVVVQAGEPEFLATMVYADPRAVADCDPCRINDLTLKVTSPSGACYFGNHGLDEPNYSTASLDCNVGTSPDTNTVDTVENVFIQNPETGTWVVEVIAVEINEDGHVLYVNNDPSECIPNQPPACIVPSPVDADFALAVSGVRPDCNENGTPDEDDIAAGTSPDCNGNSVPDECDISSGTSQDANQNGIPDECECPAPDAPAAPPPVGLLAGESYAKNRYISLVSANPGQMTAIRVTLTQCAPFDGAEGQWWVGEPEKFCENSGKVIPPCPVAPGLQKQTLVAAKLQCTPHYMDDGDWDGECEQGVCVGGFHAGESCDPNEAACRGVVHVYGVGTVPSAWTGGQLDPTTYAIQAIHEGCYVGVEDNFSAPLEITMARWGDIVKDCVTCPCGPPDGPVGVPTDVTAVLDKFKNLAPPTIPCPVLIKVRADLDWDCPNRRVDISDVTFVYDAFRGVEYPPNEHFQGPEGEEWPCP